MVVKNLLTFGLSLFMMAGGSFQPSADAAGGSGVPGELPADAPRSAALVSTKI